MRELRCSYIDSGESNNLLALRHVSGAVSRCCTDGSDSSTVPVSHNHGHALCRGQLVPQSAPAAGVCLHHRRIGLDVMRKLNAMVKPGHSELDAAIA